MTRSPTRGTVATPERRPLAPPASNSGLLEVFRGATCSGCWYAGAQARYQGSFLGMFWSYCSARRAVLHVLLRPVPV